MSFDGDSQEARRNTTIAVSVAVAAVTMVALLYWLFSSLTGPALAVAPAAVTSTATPTGTPVPTQSQTATPPPPPTIASWTPTTTFSLPPPEQPTMTAPVETPAAAQPSAPPTPAQPPAPSISNVNLQCSKGDGRRVTAKLTFTTTTKIDVVLSAGGQIDHKSVGPGNVSMSTSGRGAEICFAKIGDQTVGPIPAG
jgi:hypothetical protein